MRLNTAEQKLAVYIAKKRIEINRRKGITRALESGENDERTQILAAGGEIAFCKMFNIWPEATDLVEEPPYPLGDATCPDRRTRVDIKTTARDNPSYVYVRKSKEEKPVELYAFLSGAFPEYKLLGFLYPEELFCPANLKVIVEGREPCYRIATRMLFEGVIELRTPDR